MGKTIELAAADGHRCAAYLEEPVPIPGRKPRGAVVVIQEIFGLNRHIRETVDDYAREGFRAIAPALFDRVEPGIELGYEADDLERGKAIRARVPIDQALLDVAAAIAFMRPGKVGVVGYCWGGTVAFLAATRLAPDAAVSYYGGQVAAHAAERPRCPLIFHFGAHDKGIPMSDVASVQKAHPDVSVFTYPAGHGFNCVERADFHPDSAELAKARSLNFLEKYLS